MVAIKTYKGIYRKLQKVIPNLNEHLEAGTSSGKSQSTGFMDLHFDYLHREKDGSHRISLSHYYNENGDVVADPDMEIQVFPELESAEALTFQNRFVFHEVYEQHEGKTYMRPKLKEDLNIFLNQWLSNCIEQGHRIEMDTPEVEREAPEQKKEIREPGSEQEANPADELSALRQKNNDQDKSQGISH